MSACRHMNAMPFIYKGWVYRSQREAHEIKQERGVSSLTKEWDQRRSSACLNWLWFSSPPKVSLFCEYASALWLGRMMEEDLTTCICPSAIINPKRWPILNLIISASTKHVPGSHFSCPLSCHTQPLSFFASSFCITLLLYDSDQSESLPILLRIMQFVVPTAR